MPKREISSNLVVFRFILAYMQSWLNFTSGECDTLKGDNLPPRTRLFTLLILVSYFFKYDFLIFSALDKKSFFQTSFFENLFFFGIINLEFSMSLLLKDFSFVTSSSDKYVVLLIYFFYFDFLIVTS